MATEIEIGGRTVRHTGPAPYLARSASDRNPDWPFWYVADATGFNGLQIVGSLAKMLDKDSALRLAEALNEAA